MFTLLRLVLRAIYSYLAQGPDELSLEEGDIIELLSEQTSEDGWWEGNSYFHLSEWRLNDVL
jgi:hypothetical protein